MIHQLTYIYVGSFFKYISEKYYLYIILTVSFKGNFTFVMLKTSQQEIDDNMQVI